MLLRCILLVSCVFFAGCRVGPRYDPPCPPAPEDWKNAHIESMPDTPVVEYWWEVFDDPILNQLELEAVENNPELYVALQKIFEARALTGVVAANLYPQLNLNPAYSSEGMLIKPQFPGSLLSSGVLGGAGACSSGSSPLASTLSAPFRVHLLQYLLPLNLNYEVDLWGKIRAEVDSAAYYTEAQANGYLSAMLTLTADVASNYFHVRSLDAEILYLQDTIKTRQKNYDLSMNRFNKGIVNYLDVTQAEIDLSTAKANLDDSTRQRELAINQVAVLTGTYPTDFFLNSQPLEQGPPEIPAGIPSTMLLRRPDIAQAERTMASDHSLINAAYARFFPTLSLTGALGFSSPDIKQFLKWISRYWKVGVNSSQMVFDGGRDNSILLLTYARFKEASGAYQQQVLTAFQEVEDALNNIEQYGKQLKNLQLAVEAATKATKLSMNRYVQGVAIYLEVVENERLELQAKINWIRSLGLQYVATIQLIKALGGSWL